MEYVVVGRLHWTYRGLERQTPGTPSGRSAIRKLAPSVLKTDYSPTSLPASANLRVALIKEFRNSFDAAPSYSSYSGG